jgi:hypothetical protein
LPFRPLWRPLSKSVESTSGGEDPLLVMDLAMVDGILLAVGAGSMAMLF